jgi:RNA polymerase sigma-70 factor, ECF subfamily
MTSPDGMETNGVRDQIVEMLPSLRAFSRTLVRDASSADDLVQEAVLKAFGNISKFQDGTNLQAWLFTILRNTFYSEVRKRRREVEDVDGQHASRAVVEAPQISKLESRDFRKAMATLKSEQREALILVGPAGFNYEEAAEICGCSIGTIKSRVSRARLRLQSRLEESPAPPVGAKGEATDKLATLASGSIRYR